MSEDVRLLVRAAYRLGAHGEPDGEATAALDSLVDRFFENGRALPTPLPSDEVAARLTARERDVVQLLVTGSSTAEIASSLELTIHTVNTYMKRIFVKLGVHSRVELVALWLGTRGRTDRERATSERGMPSRLDRAHDATADGAHARARTRAPA